MVTYAQLSEMDTSKLATAANTAGTLARKLSHHGNSVRSSSDIPQEMWSGLDSMTASMKLTAQAGPLFRASDAFKRGNAALDELVDELNAAKEHLRSAQDLVAGTGITISPDGTVTTPNVDSPTRAEHHAALASQANAIIKEAIRKAEAADKAATAAIKSANTGDSGGSRGGGGDGEDRIANYFKDRFNPSLSMDKSGNTGLSLGEAKHRKGTPSWSHKLGPLSLNSGSAELNDNPFPSSSLDRFPPKLGGPFFSIGGPNVSVDGAQLAEDTKETVKESSKLLWPKGRESLKQTIDKLGWSP